MQPTQKDKATELLEALRSRPNSDVPEFVQVLRYMYEDVKERMVSCAEPEVLRYKAEAMTYKRLIDVLVRPSMKPKQ